MSRVRKNNYSKTARKDTYIEGNTVRKFDFDFEELENEAAYEEAERENSYRPRRRSLSMSGGMAMLLALVSAAILSLCVVYLNREFAISQKSAQINTLKAELEDLKAENEVLNYEVNSYMDIEYVYTYATEVLGMSVATEDQIVFYDGTDKEYLVQYKEIPEE